MQFNPSLRYVWFPATTITCYPTGLYPQFSTSRQHSSRIIPQKQKICPDNAPTHTQFTMISNKSCAIAQIASSICSARPTRSFRSPLPSQWLRSHSGCGCRAGPRQQTAYIALGSNLGDRVSEIEKACREMDKRGIRVKRTSSLWETEPMYVTDQDRFLNGACEVHNSQLIQFRREIG